MTDIRVTQVVNETVEESTVAALRLTQVVAEGVEESTVAALRLTQCVIEVLFPSQDPCATQGPPEPPPIDCPGETGDPIIDGLLYTPPVIDPCEGTGMLNGPRTGD